MIHLGLVYASKDGVELAFCLSKIQSKFHEKTGPLFCRNLLPPRLFKIGSPFGHSEKGVYSMSEFRRQLGFLDAQNKKTRLEMTTKNTRNNGQPISFQTKSATELLRLLRLQKTADPRSTALQKIAGYVAPPADVEGFQINWVGNVDSHQRKLFWGLIEMLCERLTVPFIIMMGVHNAIMTAHKSYEVSCRALVSAVGTAVATASVATSILQRKFSAVAAGWNRVMPAATSALSDAVTTCTVAALSAGPAAAVGSIQLVSASSRALVGVSSTAAAVADVGRSKIQEMISSLHGAAASAADSFSSAAAATSRHSSQRKRLRYSISHPAIGNYSQAGLQSTQEAANVPLTASGNTREDEAAQTMSFSAAVQAERRRRMRGPGRIRVRGARRGDSGGGSKAVRCLRDTMRRVVDTVQSTDLLITF